MKIHENPALPGLICWAAAAPPRPPARPETPEIKSFNGHIWELQVGSC